MPPRRNMKPDVPIKVLIVDDDEDDALIMRRHLSTIENQDFDAEWVADFDTACERIFAREHDIYLIDYRLGEKTGIDLLKVVQPENRSEPFIMMSGATDSEVLKNSMDLDAADFLLKGSFNTDTLYKAIAYAISRKELERQRINHLMELNRSKDEFISIASHQLRTPATGVKQYIGMVLEGFVGELSDTQRMMLEKAYEANDRQLVIVSDLLRVARVDAGNVVLKKELVDIGKLVDAVALDVRSVFARRKQQLYVEQPDAPLEVLVDENTVRMVCENLLENASKYSEEGTNVTIEVKDDSEFVQIVVTDEGVGVSEKDQERLFQKFSRIDNTLSTKVGGTGLGLYWSKKIIDSHGGTLEYRANGKKGSVFTIKLPKE